MNSRPKRHRMAANATAFAVLCFMLNDGQYTKDQLAEGTGLVIGTVIKWISILKRKRLVYVCRWHRDGDVGQWAAVWEWGYCKKDVVKPKAKTQSEYSRTYRAKKQIRETLENHDKRRSVQLGLQKGITSG